MPDLQQPSQSSSSSSSSSSSKLIQYTLLAKSLKGSAAAQLIEDVCSAQGVYVFGELLAVNNIDQLKSDPQFAPYHSKLSLFAYGSYRDYIAQKDSLPVFKPEQIHKLRQLSIVELSGESKILDYDRLLTHLDLTNVRELEDLIIDSIYHGILKAKLDQKRRKIDIEHAMGRDVNPTNGLDELLKALTVWTNISGDLLRNIDAQISSIQETSMNRVLERQAFEQRLNMLRRDVKENPPTRSSMASSMAAASASNAYRDESMEDVAMMDDFAGYGVGMGMSSSTRRMGAAGSAAARRSMRRDGGSSRRR